MKTRSGSAGKEKAPALQLQAREPDQVESGACPRQQMVAVAAYFRAEHRGFGLKPVGYFVVGREADVEDLLRHSH